MRLSLSQIEKKLALVRDALSTIGVSVPDNQNPWCFILKAYINNANINKNPLDVFLELKKKEIFISADELNWGDTDTGNGLGLFASALWQAVKLKLLGSTNLITSLFIEMVKNTNAETLAGLSQKIETGDGTEVPWYWIMAALQNAAITKSCGIADRVISLLASIVGKANTETLVGLSQKRETGRWAGATPWFWIMTALRNAVTAASWDIADKIISLLTSIVGKANTETLVGLSQKIEVGNEAGTTPWHGIMAALDNATIGKSWDIADRIVSLLVKIVEKADAEALVGLSQKMETGKKNARHTPWYRVMGALHEATVEKSWNIADRIISLLVSVVEKVNAETLLGLSQKIETGDEAGITPWYWVMGALCNAAAKKSWSTVDKIVSLLVKIVEKADAEALVGLSQKNETDNAAGVTPWYWIMNALILASKKNHGAQIMNLIIIIFEKFDLSSTPPLWSTLLHDDNKIAQDCDDSTFQVVQRLLLLNLVPLQNMNHPFLKEIKNNNVKNLLKERVVSLEKTKKNYAIASLLLPRLIAAPDNENIQGILYLFALSNCSKRYFTVDISCLCATYLLSPHQYKLLVLALTPYDKTIRMDIWRFLCLQSFEQYIPSGIFSVFSSKNRLAKDLMQKIKDAKNPSNLFSLSPKQLSAIKSDKDLRAKLNTAVHLFPDLNWCLE